MPFIQDMFHCFMNAWWIFRDCRFKNDDPDDPMSSNLQYGSNQSPFKFEPTNQGSTFFHLSYSTHTTANLELKNGIHCPLRNHFNLGGLTIQELNTGSDRLLREAIYWSIWPNENNISSSLDFPEIRGIPFQKATFWGEVVWRRYSLTKSIILYALACYSVHGI